MVNNPFLLTEEENIRPPEETENILFLDFDGVLHPCSELQISAHWNNMTHLVGATIFHEEKVKRVVDICNACDAKIVISSAWKEQGYGLGVFNEILNNNVIGKTPFIFSKPGLKGNRENEINKYLKDNHFKNKFAIIDDRAENFFPGNENLFLTKSENGITDEIAQQIIEFFKSENHGESS